ncbi:GAF domain-containing protein [bacterium]|nr:GAF domain-containing protein [candidate division CSSED10-310 bacterium]
MATQKKQKRSLIAKLGLFDRYNLAFVLSSIIPLGVLVYVINKYVPIHEASSARMWLNILFFSLLFLSILGFFVARVATHETVDQLKRYNSRLYSLFAISQSLSRQIHMDVLMEDIVKSAIEMTGASAGLFLLRDESKNTLRFEVTIGTGAITLKEIPISRGVAGWVADHNEIVVINNVEEDGRYQKDFNILPNFETSAILAAPLGIGAKNYGTLELLHRKEDNSIFTEEDASILETLAGQATIFIENTKFRDAQQNYFIHITEILLSSLDGTRQFWSGHLKNTARFCYLIGKHLKLSDHSMRTLHYAGLLHDIGFVKINLREGPSRKMIELHPEVGYEMIQPITVWKDVAPLIRYHHERFDGTGYPHQLGGEDIPLGSRILAVAETMDVLTNRMSYRQETLDMMQAIKEIKAYAGTQFDPAIVDALIEGIANDTGSFSL